MVINSCESLLLCNSWVHRGFWQSRWEPRSRPCCSAHLSRSIYQAQCSRCCTDVKTAPLAPLSPRITHFSRRPSSVASLHAQILHDMNIYLLKIWQNESLLITQRVMGIQAAQFLCQKFRMFAQGFDFFFFFNSVLGLLEYISYLDTSPSMSDFICNLTRTYQSLQEGKACEAIGVLKIMFAQQIFSISLSHSNHDLWHICRNC